MSNESSKQALQPTSQSELQPELSLALQESLSALVDDQASALEVRRVLRACEEDDAVRQTWARYQIARAAMRRELPVAPLFDISAAVREAIDQEDATPVTALHKSNRWLQQVGRMAIAASVAGVVVFTSQLAMTPEAPQLADSGRSTPAVATVAMPAGYGAPELSARNVSLHPAMERSSDTRFSPQPTLAEAAASGSMQTAEPRLPSAEVQAHLYRVMEAHASHAALGSVNGMLPYARVPSPVIVSAGQ